MGLDMYLNAKRAFDVPGYQAASVLDAAGLSAGDLKAQTSIYLSRWGFEESETTARSTNVEAAAGLLELACQDSASGELEWDDGKVVVSIVCAYWRKANAVHSWFVQNCQDGIDECQESPVSREDLQALREQCLAAVAAYDTGDKDVAEELMTPKAGFFFGSYDVDDWWRSDIQQTAEEIERVLRDAPQDVYFTYQASW
jgi:hypothetical protein